MTRRLLPLALLGLLGLVGASGGISGSSAASTRTWVHAIVVPGTANGDSATAVGLSCPTAGTCVVGGQFRYGHDYVAFVSDETNGSWGSAMKVPGTGAGNSYVTSVSCAAAGNCAAVGHSFRSYGIFVVDETNGRWGAAIKVPGMATLNTGGYAHMSSVSCATTGNCTAGGYYAVSGATYQAFVVDETNGSWGNAIEVPGSATLNSGGNASVNSVSCPAAGTCTAAGTYKDGSGNSQAFMVDETNGSWGDAIEVPGTADLNGGGEAQVLSVSCATAGTCAAGGYYVDGDGKLEAFVVDEAGGSWGNAIEVPGTAILNAGGDAEVSSVSCAPAGDCAAGGFYKDGHGRQQAFVIDETGGNWGTAIEVPGMAILNTGYAEITSISCATSGNCSAGGRYSGFKLFVVDETNGSWGNAIKLPGTPLNDGSFARVNTVSCAAAGACLAAGFYAERGSDKQVAFVAGSGTRAWTVPSAPHLTAAAPGHRTIRATWSKPADTGGVPMTGYEATARAGSHTFTCTTGWRLSCVITGLKDGTTYSVTVVAENTIGRSQRSNSKTARPRR